MGRKKSLPGRLQIGTIACGADLARDIERARSLIHVEGSAGPRPMNVSELCRWALHRIIDELRAGRCRPPRRQIPGEAKIVEVGKWAEGS